MILPALYRELVRAANRFFGLSCEIVEWRHD